jgi:hypothetical protein
LPHHLPGAKYWEIIVNKIIKAGFSVGWVSALDDLGAQFGLQTHIAVTVVTKG